MRSNEVKDFVRADWGVGLSKIIIETTDNGHPNLSIKINFRHADLSEYSLSARDPTWVNGITSRIEEVFSRHRTGYHRILGWQFKLLLTSVITLILAYAIFLLAKQLAEVALTISALSVG